MSRLPIRLRLTAAFALAMALLLTATGAFLYVRLAASLDQTINAGLRSRSDVVAALVRQSESGLREGGGAPLADQGESFAQVLDQTGAVVDTTPQLGRRPLLTAAEVARAARSPVLVARTKIPGREDTVRLFAAPIRAQDQQLIVVVGASTEARSEALAGLLGQLLIGGPIALALASLLAYGLAAGALRPVESMRGRAAAISAFEPGRRLPVPVARDEISRLGETLNEMLGRLERALERERGFVADASHELRTPLSLLKTELELALRRPRTREELEAAVSSAAEETDRLARLAEDLLVLARADEGRLTTRRTSTDAGAALTRVAERFAGRAQQAGRRIEVEAAPGVVLVGDELRLEQAVGNLVDNALRHGEGTVSLRAGIESGRTVVHVLDEGQGFPPAFLARAFDRFSRSGEARTDRGTGLGLAIAAAIARAHGGTAEATNRRDGGADVSLILPR